MREKNQQRQCNLCNQVTPYVLYDFGDYSIMKCRNCGLAFNSNADQVGMVQLSDIYDDDKYWLENPNERYSTVDYEQSVFLKERVQMWKRNLERLEDLTPENGRLLDIGCATGVFLDVARKRGWDTCGVEISKYGSQYAREKFKLKVITGTLNEANYPADYFNVVTMWDVIEHLTDPAGTIAEIYRILKPGGLVAIHTPNQSSLINDICFFLYRLSRKTSFLAAKVYDPRVHLYYFSKRALCNLLGSHNFTVVDMIKQRLVPKRAYSSAKIEQYAASLVDLVGGILGKPYRYVTIGRKV